MNHRPEHERITDFRQLSVIVPVYNERELVEASLTRLRATTFPLPKTTQIIVVDDASTDGTSELLTRLQAKIGFELLQHEKNRGKGAAIRSGLTLVTGDLVVFHDADLEYDPSDLKTLLQPFLENDADVVYGSRFVGSKVRRLLFFWHEVGNRFLTLLINMCTNLNFTDMETCYKMFRREHIQSFDLVSERFGIEPELTIKAARRGLRFFEVPISYNGRTYDQGKKIGWRDGVSALYCILKFSLTTRRNSVHRS